MKNYSVSEQALTEVLNYLASRPYVEVYKIVTQLQLPQITEILPVEQEVTKD